MAIVIRRYRWISADPQDLTSYVSPTAALVAQYVNAVDMQVDNVLPDAEATLDEYMNTLGYVFDPAAPPTLAGLTGLVNSWWGRTAGSLFTGILFVGPGSSYSAIVMPRAGYFLQATSYSRLTMPATGLATFQIAKAATSVGAPAPIVGTSWTMDGVGFPRSRLVPWTPGLFTFASGEKVEINLATNATAGSNDYSVTLEVVFT
jgi:hypothetical protein